MSGFNQDDQGFFQGGYEQQSSAGYDMGGGVDPYSVQEPQFGQFDYSQGGQVGGPGQQPQQQQQQQYGGDFYTQPPMQSSPYTGSVLTPDTSQSPYSGVDTTDDFENEPPLMEELGINFDHIVQKTMVVLNPLKQADCTIMTDTDLAGPLVFCLAFGGTLLLVGKVQFGFIYGIGVVGCLAMYGLLNLMSMTGVSVGCIISVLGYCLLPMVLMSSLAIVVSLQGLLGIIVTAITVFWCSLSASKLFVSALAMDNQQLLVAYPCALLYGVFALLSVF